jgi:gliding motility-associated protein GldE
LLDTFLLNTNVQGVTLLAVMILLLLIVSYFLSGAETAYFSLTYKDINLLRTKQGQSWRRIVNLLEEPRVLHASIRIANILVNITLIILSNFLIDHLFNVKDEWHYLHFAIKMLIVIFFLVLIGEVLPKVYASQNNLRFARDASYLVEIVYLLFRRIGLWFLGVSDSVERFLGKRDTNLNMQELEKDNSSTEEEKNILKGIAKFSNITVKQIMRTRLDVVGIAHEMKFSEVVQKLEEYHYSRLPVFKESLDNVVGIIHTKDVLPHLNAADQFDWHSLLRQPYFVHEQKLIEDLLQDFRIRHIHFAVVVDEFGGTSGIVTLEDIMEEIIGDIKDEFDDDDIPNEKVDDANFIFEGKVMINDVCKVMKLPISTFDQVRGDADSLAGLVLEIAGHIPQKMEEIVVGDFKFTVLEIEKNRIRKIKVTII